MSDPVDFLLLNVDFVSKFFNICVGLIQDLHESFIFLNIDHFEPVIEVVLSQELLTLLVFHRLFLDNFAFSVFDVIFENVCLFLGLSLTLFMKIVKFFGVLDNFIDKFAMAIFLSGFLATSHVLFNVVNLSCFFFVLSCELGSSVELSVN